MFKFNVQAGNAAVRGLSAEEIDQVAGGVKMGPNGEGCTHPHNPINPPKDPPTKGPFIPSTGPQGIS